MSDIFEALKDPSRRRILEILRKGPMSFGEIARHFDFTKPSLAHHLSVLKNAGLVLCKREGQKKIYWLNTTVLEDLLIFFKKLVGGKK